jgi:hypothetical protein
LILEMWRCSGLPAAGFAVLVAVSKHTVYTWMKRFEEGPASLMDRPRGGIKVSNLPDLTKRAILKMKEANPQCGSQRTGDMLLRGPAPPQTASTSICRAF